MFHSSPQRLKRCGGEAERGWSISTRKERKNICVRIRRWKKGKEHNKNKKMEQRESRKYKKPPQFWSSWFPCLRISSKPKLLAFGLYHMHLILCIASFRPKLSKAHRLWASNNSHKLQNQKSTVVGYTACHAISMHTQLA